MMKKLAILPICGILLVGATNPILKITDLYHVGSHENITPQCGEIIGPNLRTVCSSRRQADPGHKYGIQTRQILKEATMNGQIIPAHKQEGEALSVWLNIWRDNNPDEPLDLQKVKEDALDEMQRTFEEMRCSRWMYEVALKAVYELEFGSIEEVS